MLCWHRRWSRTEEIATFGADVNNSTYNPSEHVHFAFNYQCGAAVWSCELVPVTVYWSLSLHKSAKRLGERSYRQRSDQSSTQAPLQKCKWQKSKKTISSDPECIWSQTSQQPNKLTKRLFSEPDPINRSHGRKKWAVSERQGKMVVSTINKVE